MRSELKEIVHLAKYYHPAHGGIETATKDLAETAVKLGYQVRCISATSEKKSAQFSLNGVQVKSLPEKLKLFSTPLNPKLAFEKIGAPGLVHVHLPNPLIELKVLLWLLCSSKAKDQIVPYLHAYPVGQGAIGKLWFRWITTPILHRVRSILISNSYLVQSTPALAPWHGKFREIPFATDPISHEEWQSLRAERALQKRVVALGRLVPYKGFVLLLQAWAKLAHEGKLLGFTLDLIGSGPLEHELKALAKNLGIENRVTFHGSLPDNQKWALLKKSSLLVAPSITNAETFGISILEGMGYGLPVLTSNLNTGVAILARSGQCGEVARAGDMRELSEKLALMLQNSGAYLAKAGKENLEFVHKHFSRISLGERYEAFLNDHFNC